MNGVSTENKLRLIKQVRSRYQVDQRDLFRREEILYGRTSRPEGPGSVRDDEAAPESKLSFFRIRLLLAAVLFLAVVLMDQKGAKIAGIAAEDVFQAISADYVEKLDELAFSDPPALP